VREGGEKPMGMDKGRDVIMGMRRSCGLGYLHVSSILLVLLLVIDFHVDVFLG
jgi:hypothetical protein